MKEKNEGNKEGVVTMCITNGLFIIGKLVGGNKLIDPRAFDLYMEPLLDGNRNPIIDSVTGLPKAEERIRMRPLPGVPAFCTIGQDVVRYPVVTNIQNVLSLYRRVTTPVEEKSPIILPPRGSVNPALN